MGWYVELHCDGPTGGHCPYGAGEEGPQGTSIKNVSAEARRIGWGHDTNGRWRCTRCRQDLGLVRER